MQKPLLLLSFLFTSFISFCQYSFTTSQGTYQALSNPISLDSNMNWDRNTNYSIHYNFNFAINQQIYTTLNVIAGGGIIFGQGTSAKQFAVFSHTDSGYLLEDRASSNSPSSIGYEIVGNTGSQILKIQWKNAGFRDWCSSTNDSTDFVDFQIWLYENGSSFEVHYGNSWSSVTSYGNPGCNTGSQGPQVRIVYDNCSNAFSLNGPSAAPVAAVRDHCFWRPSIQLSSTPANGTVYQFNPLVTNLTEENLKQGISLFPNPTQNELTVEVNEPIQSIQLYSMNGSLVASPIEKQFKISHLQNGVYFLRVATKNKVYQERVIKY